VPSFFFEFHPFIAGISARLSREVVILSEAKDLRRCPYQNRYWNRGVPGDTVSRCFSRLRNSALSAPSVV